MCGFCLRKLATSTNPRVRYGPALGRCAPNEVRGRVVGGKGHGTAASVAAQRRTIIMLLFAMLRNIHRVK